MDCLIGKNNAGKSNILCAIKYLFSRDTKGDGKELHYNRDESLNVEVRGFFQVNEADLQRITDEDKREKIKRKLVLDDGTIGICRRTVEGYSHLKAIRYYPSEDKLSKENFYEFHENAWEERQSNTDFRDEMKEKYPRLIEYLREDKETNKGEWTRAYSQLIQERPEDIEFKKRAGEFPTGTKTVIQKKLLPRIIDVPAVKHAEDATSTSNRAELGKLLSEVSSEIEEEVNQAIQNSMQDVFQKLNTVNNGGNRLNAIDALEGQLSEYIAETFKDHSISLEFPKPDSEMMFNQAELKLQEEGMGKVSIENCGEGIKRVLIFSLFRTLADLQQGELEFQDSEENVSKRPILILYEEAELFLHPGLQRTLLRVFSSLRDNGNQMIFSTHSPLLIRDKVLSTINMVKKSDQHGTHVREFHELINEKSDREKDLLAELKNVSSYIFTDKIVLVEGKSDKIALKKIADKLHPDWNFEEQGVQILQVESKYNLPLFKEFLEDLGIEVYVMTDIDAVKKTVSEISEAEEVQELREDLENQAEKVKDNTEFIPNENSELVNDTVSSYDWAQTFDKLRELKYSIENNESVNKEQLQHLQRLLNKKYEDAWEKAIISDHEEIKNLRMKLKKKLLNEGILLLSGEIEDYYGGSKSNNKITEAIKFEPGAISEETLKSKFEYIGAQQNTDIELFLKDIFNN